MLAVLGRKPAELTKPASQRHTSDRGLSIAVDQLMPSADKAQAAYPSMGRAVKKPPEVSFERPRVHIGNLSEAVEVKGLVQIGAQPRNGAGEPRWQGSRSFRSCSDRPITRELRAGHDLDASNIGPPPREQYCTFLSGNERDVASRIAE